MRRVDSSLLVVNSKENEHKHVTLRLPPPFFVGNDEEDERHLGREESRNTEDDDLC